MLISEVIDALKPETGKVIVDGTFGAGGYTRRILEQGASVIAIDRDRLPLQPVVSWKSSSKAGSIW
ncbi:hypothetical protein AB664_22685 [Brucella anthropi]|uniref:S-adenosyl-methyltransferase MraW n=1 Tax=Brucella anthropi TaxID=529 RepID=A0A656Z922_BRUAN|nr:hypothetical protein AB664_22685 [Brucella anthropi]